MALNQDVRPDRHTWTYGDSRNVEQTAPSGTQHTTWESSLSFAVCVGGLLVRDEPPTPTRTPGSPATSFPGRWDSNGQLRWMLGSGEDGEEAELHALPFLFFHAVVRPRPLSAFLLRTTSDFQLREDVQGLSMQSMVFSLRRLRGAIDYGNQP